MMTARKFGSDSIIKVSVLAFTFIASCSMSCHVLAGDFHQATEEDENVSTGIEIRDVTPRFMMDGVCQGYHSNGSDGDGVVGVGFLANRDFNNHEGVYSQSKHVDFDCYSKQQIENDDGSALAKFLRLLSDIQARGGLISTEDVIYLFSMADDGNYSFNENGISSEIYINYIPEIDYIIGGLMFSRGHLNQSYRRYTQAGDMGLYVGYDAARKVEYEGSRRRLP